MNKLMCSRNPLGYIIGDLIQIGFLLVFAFVFTGSLYLAWLNEDFSIMFLIIVLILDMLILGAVLDSIGSILRHIGIKVEKLSNDIWMKKSHETSGRVQQIITEGLFNNRVRHKLVIKLLDGTKLISEPYNTKLYENYILADGTQYSALGYPEADVYKLYISNNGELVGRECKVWNDGDKYIIKIENTILDAERQYEYE